MIDARGISKRFDAVIAVPRRASLTHDGALPPAVRKRKQWLLYVDRWLQCLTWQGATARAYEYWFAMANQSFARASCVGCGMCAHMCPRGVLKLELRPVGWKAGL